MLANTAGRLAARESLAICARATLSDPGLNMSSGHSGNSINDMKDMLASLPEMREVKEKVRAKSHPLLPLSCG